MIVSEVGLAERVVWDRADVTVSSPTGEVLTAAADVGDGAMVALVPSDADLNRLVVDGGEPRGQLHLTLAYLGDAADWSPRQRTSLVKKIGASVEDAIKPDTDDLRGITGQAFGANFWNPDARGDREPSWNLAVGGDELDWIHGMIWEDIRNLEGEVPLPEIPEQHTPWVPHICLAYSADPGLAREVAKRVGPITFDRLRVAFAGEILDFSLTTRPVAGGAFHLPGQHDQADHGRHGTVKFHTSGLGTADDPVKTNDAWAAADALAAGKHVRLDSTRQISTLLDRLHQIGQEAAAAGVKAGKYDLCKVSVPRTNLFCKETKGVPRIKMPQFRGVPRPNSRADRLPKTANGKTDLTRAFVDHLRSRGVDVRRDVMDAKYMKATQAELDGVKVAGMMKAMQAGKLNTREGFAVTPDGYVVDGHHLWAAGVGLAYAEGKPVEFPVDVIDADILDVLDMANTFTDDMGLPHAAGGRTGVFHLPGVHDQSTHGRHHMPRVAALARPGMGDVPIGEQLAQDFANGSAAPHLVKRPDGSYEFTDERQRLHDRIIEKHMKGKTRVRNPEFSVLGGGPAAGKSTVVETGQIEALNRKNAVLVNADDMKAELPEYRGMIASGDRRAASFAHEESSYLAARLQAASFERGLHVVLDGTGNSSPKKLAKKVDAARRRGYKVNAYYVTVPTDEAVRRAEERAKQTGRFVPETVIRTTHAAVSQTFAGAFKVFDTATVYDTTDAVNVGPKPLMRWDGQREVIVDPDGWKAFIEKANERPGWE